MFFPRILVIINSVIRAQLRHYHPATPAVSYPLVHLKPSMHVLDRGKASRRLACVGTTPPVLREGRKEGRSDSPAGSGPLIGPRLASWHVTPDCSSGKILTPGLRSLLLRPHPQLSHELFCPGDLVGLSFPSFSLFLTRFSALWS